MGAIADKVIQSIVTELLNSIYDQDFINSSYAYRPNLGAQK